MSQCTISADITADDLRIVASHMDLHPPDGDVEFEQAEDGGMVARWQSDGEKVSAGPVIKRDLPGG